VTLIGKAGGTTADLRLPFEEADLQTASSQQSSRGQSTDAAAHHHDFKFHGLVEPAHGQRQGRINRLVLPLFKQQADVRFNDDE